MARGRVRPPSALWRGVVAVFFLVGFYVTMLGIAAALFVVAPLFLFYQRTGFGLHTLALFLVTWIPAVLLLMGIGMARPPKWKDPGRRLEREDAPELFAILEDLGSKVGTRPPEAVYVTPLVDLGVTETGGFFGWGSRRVLVLGAPVLSILDVGELRAALAHELGHFAGGETRLSGLHAYTLACFQSVVAAGKRGPFDRGTHHVALELGLETGQALTRGLVVAYSALYLWATRPTSRRQEIAADALAAEIAGRANVRRGLEKVALDAPMYQHYLNAEVGSVAVRNGAIPSDLLEGYALFRARFLGTLGGKAFQEALRTRPTHRFDTHPALPDRLAFLADQPEGPTDRDTRSALDLVDVKPSTESWLVGATLALFEVNGFKPPANAKRLPWSRINAEIVEPELKAGARRVAAALHPLFPDAATLCEMLGSVVDAFEKGRSHELAMRISPEVARLSPVHRAAATAEIGTTLVSALLQGALLERGGAVDDSLGLPHAVFRLDSVILAPLEVARAAMIDKEGSARLSALARRLLDPAPLLHPPGSEVPSPP